MSEKRNRGGRPRKTTGPADSAADTAVDGGMDVLDYLVGVALGKFPADAIRVAAAKASLPYVRTKTRAPLQNKRPAELAQSARLTADRESAAEWERKRDEILAAHGRK